MTSTIVLKQGSNQIARALLSGTPVRSIKFKVSPTAGVTPDYNATDLTTSVYEGSEANIIATLQSEQTIRYALQIPQEAGPFDIGSIMLFATGDLGQVALIHDIYDNAFTKEVGNTYVANITVKIQDLESTVTPTVTPVNLAQLPTVVDETKIPSVGLSSWQSFIVQRDNNAKRPTMVTRYTAGSVWYSNWLWQKLDDPYFGCLYGGIIGDGFSES